MDRQTTEQEVWKDIPNYEGLYLISNCGRVKSLIHNIILKSRTSSDYDQVALYKNKIRKDTKVHQLVAKLFIPNPQGKPYINHKDSNKLNNRVENLEWCTHKENIRHSFEHGFRKINYGTDSHRAKLNELQVREIRLLCRMRIHQKLIAKYYNIHHSVVSRINIKKTYSNVP